MVSASGVARRRPRALERERGERVRRFLGFGEAQELQDV